MSMYRLESIYRSPSTCSPFLPASSSSIVSCPYWSSCRSLDPICHTIRQPRQSHPLVYLFHPPGVHPVFSASSLPSFKSLCWRRRSERVPVTQRRGTGGTMKIRATRSDLLCLSHGHESIDMRFEYGTQQRGDSEEGLLEDATTGRRTGERKQSTGIVILRPQPAVAQPERLFHLPTPTLAFLWNSHVKTHLHRVAFNVGTTKPLYDR